MFVLQETTQNQLFTERHPKSSESADRKVSTRAIERSSAVLYINMQPIVYTARFIGALSSHSTIYFVDNAGQLL